MWWVRLILLLLLLLQRGSSSNTTTREPEHTCPPSSCGKISNISYPFRLKDDPKHCGDSKYELSCENNITTLDLYYAKYHVQSINYNNITVRLVDPRIQQDNCASLPLNFLSQSDFCGTYKTEIYCMDPYQASSSSDDDDDDLLFKHIVYLNCSHQVTNNPKYVDTTPCLNLNSKSKDYHVYAMAGDLIAEDFQLGCHVILVTPTSWSGLLENHQLLSYDVIHKALVYGFEISWFHLACNNHCGDLESCYFKASTEKLQCYSDDDCSNTWHWWIHHCG